MGPLGTPDALSYALIALAQRKALHGSDLFGYYSRVADPSLRLTFIWCLGANADRAIVPDLAKLLYDGNIRIRTQTAMSLAALGDPAALPALRELQAHDAHHYGRNQAELAIKQIEQSQK